jgi:hypothetical protein
LQVFCPRVRHIALVVAHATDSLAHRLQRPPHQGCNDQEEGKGQVQGDGEQEYYEQFTSREADRKIDVVESGDHGITISS